MPNLQYHNFVFFFSPFQKKKKKNTLIVQKANCDCYYLSQRYATPHLLLEKGKRSLDVAPSLI